MLAVIPGDVGLCEVPQAGDEEDDEDDEDDEDPSVNGVVETRPLGVLCRFVGIDCWVMLLCGACCWESWVFWAMIGVLPRMLRSSSVILSPLQFVRDMGDTRKC